MAYKGGASTYINFPCGTADTDSIFVSMRIKTPSSNTGIEKHLCGRGDDDNGYWSIGLYWSNSNSDKLVLATRTTGQVQDFLVGATALSTNTVYQVGFYFNNSTGAKKIIINGAVDQSSNPGNTTLMSSTHDILLGVGFKPSTQSSNQFWQDGGIEDFAVWVNHEVTGSDLTDLATKHPSLLGTPPNYLWTCFADARPHLGTVYGTRSGSPAFDSAYMTHSTWPSSDVTSNCVFSLAMDESGTGAALDTSGNGRDFTATNSPTSEAAKVGTHSRGLNGTNQYFSRSYESALFPTDKLTVVGWFYTGSFAAAEVLLVAGLYNTDYSMIVQVADANTINVTLVGSGGGSSVVSATSLSMSTNTWYEIVVIIDTAALSMSDMVVILINNALPSRTLTESDYTTFSSGLKTISAGAYYFGKLSGLDIQYFTGRLDQWGLYHRAWTPWDATASYNSGSGYDPYATSGAVIKVWQGGIGFPMTGGIRG